MKHLTTTSIRQFQIISQQEPRRIEAISNQKRVPTAKRTGNYLLIKK